MDNIDEYKPHEVAEVICLYCWISVHEQGEWLAKWECPKCGKIGGIIYTGQPL